MLLHRVFVLPLVLAAFGCSYDYDDDRHHDWHGDVQQNTDRRIARAGIDVDATLADLEPGRGTGAFVEYRSDGAWHVFTTCDTELSGYSCLWDILVRPLAASIHAVSAEGLEHEDFAEFDDSSAQLIADNDFDFDGIIVESDPGASMRVDVFLDGRPAERYVYWVESGGLHRGAPTNPIDLSPGAP